MRTNAKIKPRTLGLILISSKTLRIQSAQNMDVRGRIIYKDLYRPHVLRALVRIGPDEVVRQAPGAQRQGLFQHGRLLRRARIHDLPHLDLLH